MTDELVKRQIVLFEESEDATGFVMPTVHIADKAGDFTITVSEEVIFRMRAQSSGVREQWLQALAQYCEFPGQERLVPVNRSVQMGGALSALDGKHKFEEKYVHYKDHGRLEPIIDDCEMLRVAIPGDTAVRINVSTVVKLCKDLVGKDLSKFSMPVFVNEPTSILMKPAETMFFNDFLTQASKEEESVRRLLFVVAKQLS